MTTATESSDLPEETPPPVSTNTPVSPNSKRGNSRVGFAVLALLAISLSGYSVWKTHRIEQQLEQSEFAGDIERFKTELRSLQHTSAQKQQELEKIRTRLADQENVNKSLREEVLSTAERARLLEDTVANLAEKRQSGHDNILLDDAELLLLFAQQRYSLFQDATFTINTYKIVDSLLAEMEDPAFASTRQTLNAEIEALISSKRSSASEVSQDLRRLQDEIDRLPIKPHLDDSDDSSASKTSRLEKLFRPFVRISRNTDATTLLLERDTELARQLILLDLREAQAALLIQDTSRFQQAIKNARTACATRFDTNSAAVNQVLNVLDKLLGVSWTVSPPSIIGATLKELRNLRSLHKLRNTPGTPDGSSSKSDNENPI